MSTEGGGRKEGRDRQDKLRDDAVVQLNGGYCVRGSVVGPEG